MLKDQRKLSDKWDPGLKVVKLKIQKLAVSAETARRKRKNYPTNVSKITNLQINFNFLVIVAGKTDKDIADPNNDIVNAEWLAWYTEIKIKMEKVVEENKKI